MKSEGEKYIGKQILKSQWGENHRLLLGEKFWEKGFLFGSGERLRKLGSGGAEVKTERKKG